MSASDTPIHSAPSRRPAQDAPRRDLSGRILGDYRVERLLGHGGMGEVYLARQVSLDRPVALKVLKPELLSNPTYLARFEKEALSAAKLNHPNIVHIYSLGEFDGLKFIAMEYVEGTNLKEFLAKKGPPELPPAVAIMRQAGQAVAAAGELGLIHRDIKPENLLLTRKGQIKVADFGLCRTHAPSEMDLTQEGVTLGTPMYMSPEQVQGKELDHRSDLYSLGISFYHMLAGVPPFRAETPLALALKHVRDTPADLSVHRPDLPPEVCRLVMKLIAKRPADRYGSAAEMLRELARIKETLQTPSVTATLPDGLSNGADSGGVASQPTASGQVRRPRLRGSLAMRPLRKRDLAVVLIVAGILGAFLGSRGRATDLLSDAAPTPTGPPGLWMAPWQDVPARTTAAAQYRHAQFEAPRAEREAAWLAVPARFPKDRDWANRSYIQLARTLFRRGDAERLDALAGELTAAGSAAATATAKVARAAAHALRGEVEEVFALLEGASFEARDPALNELSLEVTHGLARSSGVGASARTRLRKVGEQLNAALQLDPLNRLGVAAPGR